MKKEQLLKILDDISKVTIGIVGDFCLDAYWFTDESTSEISIETGLVTRPVSQQKYYLGGAGNVANNLTAMGVKDVRAFGVVGPDPFGTKMMGLMKEAGVGISNVLVQDEKWSTHVFSKPHLNGEEQNRIDFGNFNSLTQTTADELLERLKAEIPDIDLIIINQQVLSGIHTPYFRDRLIELIQASADRIFISDSRRYSDEYDGAYRKLNDFEAVMLCSDRKEAPDYVSYSEAHDAAKELFEKYKKPLFITRGGLGSLIVDSSGITDIYGLVILSKVDTVGAGDSYLAGIASSMAAGYDMETAAKIGTFVAGVTVQKLFQTGTATPAEILAIGNDPDYIYLPELADNIRQVCYIENTEIEVVNKWSDDLQIKYAIFDHDGTISTLREGWELIMATMMVKAILGKKYADADESLLQKVQLRIDEFIDKTTGIQTLVQMKWLLELIKEFGFIPEDEILDEFEYKSLYNEELLKMVRQREHKLKAGELSLADFTIKNAVLFLQALYDAGIKLYLASGTDVEDVKNEAQILGYGHLFEGRIYGAVGDVTKEAKKTVLDGILESIGESAFGEVATFGDGPVEMRETRKYGGVTIGIASNELKRFELNKHKRSRLIKAGADIIIPDFSQYVKLLELLNIR